MGKEDNRNRNWRKEGKNRNCGSTAELENRVCKEKGQIFRHYQCIEDFLTQDLTRKVTEKKTIFRGLTSKSTRFYAAIKV